MQRYRHQDRGHRGNERLGRNANFSGMPRVGLGETKPPGILRKEGPFRRSTKPIEAGLDTRRLVSYSPRRLGNPIVEGAPVLLATVPWRDVLLESNRLLSDKVLKVFLKPDTIAVRRNRKLVRTKRLANGRCQRLDLVTGDVSIGPAVNMRGLRGNDPPELPVLSPDEALIRRNGAAWYDPALVELIRHGCAGDPLIEQIAIVLKSDLVEERALGNLYGEALANALAAQLLRRNYSPRANDLASKGGLGGRRLKLTLDYLDCPQTIFAAPLSAALVCRRIDGYCNAESSGPKICWRSGRPDLLKSRMFSASPIRAISLDSLGDSLESPPGDFVHHFEHAHYGVNHESMAQSFGGYA